MKIQGRSHREVAEVLLVTVNTVTRWLGVYVEEGLEALCTMHWQGDPGELSNEQLEALKSELRSKTYRNAKQVQDYIAKTFDVEYSVRGVQDLLHRLGFTYHQSALIASRADPEAQARFVEKYFELRDQLDEGGLVFFR
jgi:transposase